MIYFVTSYNLYYRVTRIFSVGSFGIVLCGVNCIMLDVCEMRLSMNKYLLQEYLHDQQRIVITISCHGGLVLLWGAMIRDSALRMRDFERSAAGLWDFALRMRDIERNNDGLWDSALRMRDFERNTAELWESAL